MIWWAEPWLMSNMAATSFTQTRSFFHNLRFQFDSSHPIIGIFPIFQFLYNSKNPNGKIPALPAALPSARMHVCTVTIIMNKTRLQGFILSQEQWVRTTASPGIHKPLSCWRKSKLLMNSLKIPHCDIPKKSNYQVLTRVQFSSVQCRADEENEFSAVQSTQVSVQLVNLWIN